MGGQTEPALRGRESSSGFENSSDGDPELLAAATPSASTQRQQLKVEVDRILEQDQQHRPAITDFG